MNLDKAERLARAGHAGAVATALLLELERVRAELRPVARGPLEAAYLFGGKR